MFALYSGSGTQEDGGSDNSNKKLTWIEKEHEGTWMRRFSQTRHGCTPQGFLYVPLEWSLSCDPI